MSSPSPPKTIESFYRYLSEKKFMGTKCSECGSIHLPPREACPTCGSRRTTWIKLKGRGKLVAHTIIHVAPPQFQSIAPYAAGIVDLEEGTRVFGTIREIEPQDVANGMKLEISFDTKADGKWPAWPRYFFIPSKAKTRA